MKKKTTFRRPPFKIDRARRGDLASQVADGLRTAIETGYYRPGDILPPVRDLGELLGVSMVVAVHAVDIIREEGLISPRPRVGSVVCAKDRPLWKGHVVIVVPPGCGNPYENMVFACLRDTLTSAGYLATPVTVAPSRPGRYDDFALLDTVLRQQTDLVVQLQAQENITRHLAKAKVPFVRLAPFCTRPPNCAGILRLDDDLAIPDFAAHCREAGVRRVIQVSGFPHSDVTAALEAVGVKVATVSVPDGVESGTGYELAVWARDFFADTLAKKGRAWLPDVLFFNDDHLTTGANRNYGPVFAKPLTRMEMDSAAIGEKLAECVMDFLRDGTFPEGIVVGPRYIRGETF